jgi:hypothetical protein
VIRIHRGKEPNNLASTRDKHLRDALAKFTRYGAGSDALHDALKGYDVAKSTLYKRQFKKCAYCERRCGLAGQPTEHFRPKAMARRGTRDAPGDVDRERYWWLTWSWDNLLFACVTCNSQANKANWFPLEPLSAPLPVPSKAATWPLPAALFDTSNEAPMLVDPGSEDPLDHLRWVPVDRTLAPGSWSWKLKALTPRGEVTRQVLGLDQLADEITDQAKDLWRRFAKDVLEPNVARKALQAWSWLTSEFVDPKRPHAGANWSILDVLRHSSDRAKRLQLPSPQRPS